MVLSVNAQAPGYMGYRKIVSYDLYLSPALISPNYQGDKGIASYNYRHVLNFDFANDLHHTIGFSASYTRSKSNFIRPVNGTFRYIHQGETMYTDELSFGNTSSEISVYGIGLNLKKIMSDNYIAPLGWYFKPEFTLFIINSSFDAREMDVNVYMELANKSSYDDKLLNYPAIDNNITCIAEGLSVMFGKQTIYFDRIVINIGVEMGYVFGGMKFQELLGETSPKSIPEEGYTQTQSKSRLCGINFFNFVTGIGYVW
jgi:hypothetical protein